jgi:hypothetical protein
MEGALTGAKPSEDNGKAVKRLFAQEKPDEKNNLEEIDVPNTDQGPGGKSSSEENGGVSSSEEIGRGKCIF